jgi:hypothetical protein
MAAQSVRADEAAVTWHTDYAQAQREARSAKKLLLVMFHQPKFAKAYDDYLSYLEKSPQFVKAAQNAVLCKLPLDYEVRIPPAAGTATDKPAEHPATKLLSHGAFAEMHGRPGFVIIDYFHTKSKHFGHVVNVYPFKGRFMSVDRLAVMLKLPEGSLTQRTMIYAVMTHPERPASVQGQFARELAEEAESHSKHQARIGVQGHHQWESRFHRINARLGRGLLSQEVVAESWPGQDLVEAAEECVHSWRQSSGHWSAVRSRAPMFAYDIKRGLNGIWYATGIFGRR